jgi:hypothetical protein
MTPIPAATRGKTQAEAVAQAIAPPRPIAPEFAPVAVPDVDVDGGEVAVGEDSVLRTVFWEMVLVGVIGSVRLRMVLWEVMIVGSPEVVLVELGDWPGRKTSVTGSPRPLHASTRAINRLGEIGVVRELQVREGTYCED